MGKGHINVALGVQKYSINSVSADYIILDTDQYDAIGVDASAGDIDITLPTLAANTGRIITIRQDTVGGMVRVVPEGGETIDLNATYLPLLQSGDYATLYSNGTDWKVISYKSIFDTGWIGRSDWTVVEMGCSSFDYDGLVGTFDIGEVISDGTTFAQGIVMADTGSNLIVKNVTVGGVFNNNDVITGASSGATADVDEPAGSTSSKDKDGNITHNLNANISELDIHIYWSSGGTDATAVEIAPGLFTNHADGNLYGFSINQVNTSSFKVQTATNGIAVIDDAGALAAIAANDDFYKVVVTRMR